MYLKATKKFENLLAGVLVKAKAETLKRAKEIAREALQYAVTTSPQYTGTFASNWRLTIESRDPRRAVKTEAAYFRALFNPFQEGDNPAVAKAINAPGNKLSQLQLGQKVYLSTTAVDWEGEDYAFDVEQGVMRFRDVNPSGGKVLERTKQHIKVAFAGALK